MITGYRKFRPISDNDLAYVRIFMLIRALVSIGWYSARPEVTAGNIVLPQLIDYVRSNAVSVMASHGIFIEPMPSNLNSYKPKIRCWTRNILKPRVFGLGSPTVSQLRTDLLI